MYNLYIIDNDPMICRSLKQSIRWRDLDVDVAGTALNGEQALELMSARPPDIVVTDMNMPRMDGLELIFNVRQQYPHTKVIMLSAHSELKYVRAVSSLKVLDYVLKPAENRMVYQKVAEAIRELEKEKILDELLSENLTVIREKFLNSLLSGAEYSMAQLEQKLGFLNSCLDVDGEVISGIVLIEHFSSANTHEPELEKHRVIRIVRKALSEYFKCECFLRGDKIVFLISLKSHGIPPSELDGFLRKLFRDIISCCENEVKTVCTIGYGTARGLARIRESYGEAKEAMIYHSVIGSGEVYSPYEPKNDWCRNPKSEIVCRAIKYMMENYSDHGLSLHTVASKINISPSYLCTVFKRETSSNLKDFIIRIRMKRAMELLTGSNYKFYEIADMLGYTSAHYFSASFKKHTGMSPSEYKDQNADSFLSMRE